MSSFYGQVKGSGKNAVHQGGSEASHIRASAQSWKGSVIIEMYYGKDGGLNVGVEVADGSEFHGRLIFDGSFEEFKDALEKGE